MSYYSRITARVICVICILGISISIPSRVYSRPEPQQPSSYGSNQLIAIMDSAITEVATTTKARGGCGLLLDANSGRIIAATTISMSGQSSDAVIAGAWEPGSVMKPLLIAAAINEGTIDPNQSNFSNTSTYVDDFLVTNAKDFPEPIFTVQDIVSESINAGAIQVLKTLSTANAVDHQSRHRWHEYLTKHYLFGKPTYVATVGESKGYVPPPKEGPNLNVQYANTAIGQSLTVSPVQLASAYAAIVNGGTYYKPQLSNVAIEQPIILQHDVVSSQTSQTMRQLLEKSFDKNWPTEKYSGVTIGGKSGTAHSASPSGDYYSGKDNGTYVGYIERNNQLLILLVRIDEPSSDDFASREAGRAWTRIAGEILRTETVF